MATKRILGNTRAYSGGKRKRKRRSLMQTGYFNAAWQDIKNTPGWFGKLILLSLLSFVPIFGWLVVLGYLYGWRATSHGTCTVPCRSTSSATRTASCTAAASSRWSSASCSCWLRGAGSGMGRRHGPGYRMVGRQARRRVSVRRAVDDGILAAHHCGGVFRDAVLMGGFHAHEHIRPPGRGVPVR